MDQIRKPKQDRPLHVLFIAAEADPFIKVGGLGDVAGSLPVALKQLKPDLDIRLAIPYYDAIHQSGIPAKLIKRFFIPTLKNKIEVLVYETDFQGVPVYLIDGEPISATKAVYGANFALDAEKFVFFSLACLLLPVNIAWSVDILHANDWHTAIAIHELSIIKSKYPQLSNTKSLMTIHNLPFMGTGAQSALTKYLIPPARNPRMPAWARTLPLPMGVNSADKINTVSPTYANEILRSGFGCDLQNFFKTKQRRLSGILNGIDFSAWDPQTDKCIKGNYSENSLEQREANKVALLQEFGLPESPNIPLLTFIGRLDSQKGIDLALEALLKIKVQKWNVIFLGTGDKTIEVKIQEFQSKFPKKVRSALRFDGALSHRLYAGSDILLMPSRYEPCGLAQMIAMRYGCVPVANATGGLMDTIQDFIDNPKNATGFLSREITAADFSQSISSAIKTYHNSKIWIQIQRNGMEQNNSWQNSAIKYYDLYQSLL